MFYVSWGDDFLWKIGSQVFYKNLVSAMNNIIEGKDQAKMQLHFSHDYMLSILMNGLGKLFQGKIPFASTLFFELHKINGDYFVRTLYNDQPLQFGDCKEDLCPFTTFKDYMSKIHPEGDIRELCAAKNLDTFQRSILLEEDSAIGGSNFNQFKKNLMRLHFMPIMITFTFISVIVLLSTLIIKLYRRGIYQKNQDNLKSLLPAHVLNDEFKKSNTTEEVQPIV